MSRTERQQLIDKIAETLQWSARSRSKDGMTGISDDRAHGLALDVADLVLRDERDLTFRILVSTPDQ